MTSRQTKVFTIRPHKVQSTGAEDATIMWGQLESSFHKIYAEQHGDLSYEQNYRFVSRVTAAVLHDRLRLAAFR